MCARKNEGYNVMYRLIDLNIPFIYSSLHTSYKMLRERPEIVQRMVAAFGRNHLLRREESRQGQSVRSAKAMRTNDQASAAIRLRRLR